MKELKSRLEEYLDFVSQGKVIAITRRGRIVAELRRTRKRRNTKPSIDDIMKSLAEQGLVDLAKKKGPIGLHPGVKVRDPKATMRFLDQLIASRKLR